MTFTLFIIKIIKKFVADLGWRENMEQKALKKSDISLTKNTTQEST